jgi:DNA-binding SARP family transcriptional activator/TolB-like protein
VEATVGGGVEKAVETAPEVPAGVELRLLGPLMIKRQGRELALPASRKARALIAYLSLAPHQVSRGQLCELLWDVPNDPRGELRWCLSKLRGLIDEPGRQRVESRGDSIRLDLQDCFVDAVEISRATQQGIETLPAERLRQLCALFSGELLHGLEIDRNPSFNSWLTAQRRRFRACHTALLEQLAKTATGDDVFAYLEQLAELAPFDQRVHEMLLAAFARRGRIREGEEHLAATVRLFEAEGLDCAGIQDLWRVAKTRREGSAQQVSVGVVPVQLPGEPVTMPSAPRRASIAVMPFVEATPLIAASHAGPAGALAHDVITRLAKLRSLFVIAQGTMFALSERRLGPEEAGRMLNVDYIVSGSLRRQGDRLRVAVELAETRTARIVWAEVFEDKLDDAFRVLDEIGNRIVASIATEVETLERNRAILKPPNSLDAWEAHHRGLWHMYRFNKPDNDLAKHFFETAVRLDPTFARAYAGLSFTHFQNAFQGWAKRGPEIDRAFEAAGQSLMADDRDPAAHWAMGRALWLRGRQDLSVVELECAIDLSPNFALGHYTLAFVHSQGGDPSAAVTFSDQSRHLSPFDPMLFAMFGSRAMALVRLKRFEEAAEWAMKAAARPNAHAHIRAIAAFCLALAGRRQEGQSLLATIHQTRPNYRADDFLAAFQFEPDAVALYRHGAKLLGLK